MFVHAHTLPESSYFHIIPTLHSYTQSRGRDGERDEDDGVEEGKGRKMKGREGKGKVPVAFYFIIIRRLRITDVGREISSSLPPPILLFSFSLGGSFWHKHTNTVLFDVTATCCSLPFYDRSLFFLRN